MELNFTKEQVIKILKSYYKIHEGQDVDIIINATKGCEGLYETPCVDVAVNVVSKLSILGELVEVKAKLEKDEIKNMFKVMLNDEDYNMQYLDYNTKFASIEGTYNETEKIASFDGIVVGVKPNVKQKKLEN